MAKPEDMQEHGKQHHAWTRRLFLRSLGLGAGGTMMLGGSSLMGSSISPLLAASESDRVLVILRLKGGNDGLNTIIPVYDYSTYQTSRPTVHVAQTNTFSLTGDFAMPDFMEPLQNLWGDGKMKVVHGVGYENQDLSHFYSSDVWFSASESDHGSGMMGRYYENQFPDFLNNLPDDPLAIQVGGESSILFEGTDTTDYSFSVADPLQLYQIAQNGWLHDINNLPDCLYGEQLGFIRAVTNSTVNYAGVVHEAFASSTNDVNYESTPLSGQLAMIARLIKGGLSTKVYMLTLDGFDTHAEQPIIHQELLTDLANGVRSFYDDLATTGHDSRVLCMSISEFGRRVDENASFGTDHGAAAPVMFFGQGLNGNGFVGQHPSLTDLDQDGNLIASTDFRSVYATVLQEWLCIPGQLVDDALGSYYSRLSLGFQCLTSTPEPLESSANEFIHYPVYTSSEVFVKYTIQNPSIVKVELINIAGMKVAELFNGNQQQGEYQVRIGVAGNVMAAGPYVYRIWINDQPYSRKVILP